jgi:hypothetical protein
MESIIFTGKADGLNHKQKKILEALAKNLKNNDIFDNEGKILSIAHFREDDGTYYEWIEHSFTNSENGEKVKVRLTLKAIPTGASSDIVYYVELIDNKEI